MQIFTIKSNKKIDFLIQSTDGIINKKINSLIKLIEINKA